MAVGAAPPFFIHCPALRGKWLLWKLGKSSSCFFLDQQTTVRTTMTTTTTTTTTGSQTERLSDEVVEVALSSRPEKGSRKTRCSGVLRRQCFLVVMGGSKRRFFPLLRRQCFGLALLQQRSSDRKEEKGEVRGGDVTASKWEEVKVPPVDEKKKKKNNNTGRRLKGRLLLKARCCLRKKSSSRHGEFSSASSLWGTATGRGKERFDDFFSVVAKAAGRDGRRWTER